MDYEKAYKDALERAKGIYNETWNGYILKIFPELAESEDERIRKEIYNALRYLETELSWDALGRVDMLDAYAWLEKQGEQKSTPPKWKYKKDNTPLLRDSIILNKYGGVAKSPSGAIVSDVWVLDYDELAKLPKEELEKQGEQKPNPYTGTSFEYDAFDKYEGLTNFERTLADICNGWIGEEIGWKQYIKDNADVLLKIAIEKFNSIQDAPFEKQSKWTEEDEKCIDNCCLLIGAADDCYEKTFKDGCIHYLQRLKERIVWKPKWTEEDESKVEDIVYFLDTAKVHYASTKALDDCVTWIKSLKQKML